ncbi:DUF2800 domain-containing protein [Clostridium botulinum]|uniref:DUF2800 domain-containing protein n=1 Tax=Clostridium TaxID=1485 RepID=UPI0013F9CB8D|nr:MULTISPECIES: DUF2800 domain-containing protein [Clostridium]MCS6103448.1 DUF2800 domain-containing protein [Clostridium botulinum]MCS6106533.1 DUF2800 domain-containing protein [Clostridium botulinum]MCS6130415.1 DUF2800 domain-containing protein [Clostridium botulinum]NFL44768.1 DUF2800 domain-containing protein [Clostridium botulinum]NFL88813.1 DUF2800 domain-containing protein [Clostridium botulinum]
MAKHALLSASSSSRWLNCPPSVKLEEGFENTTSVFAEEGTLAHELGEIALRLNLGEFTKRKYSLQLAKIMENELFTKDMPDYVDMYVDTCMEKLSEAKATTPDAIAIVEQKLDFSNWVPDGFGTGDFVIIADGTMEICDLKYGKGVQVSAKDNSQMRLYALGAISQFEFLYDIQNVKMTIIQPRLDSISTDEMTIIQPRLDSISTDEMAIEELLKWADEVVKPTAELAIKGEGEFCTGDHCKFCRAKAVCRARADKNMELAQYEFQKPPTLDNNDIGFILNRVDELTSWAKDVKEYALNQALKGEEFDGFKVVEGKSNRKWTNEKAVGDILIEQGFLENIIYTKKLTGISNMETAIGKKEVNRLLGNYIVKPQGKPTLASETDKRPVFNPAKADFE